MIEYGSSNYRLKFYETNFTWDFEFLAGSAFLNCTFGADILVDESSEKTRGTGEPRKTESVIALRACDSAERKYQTTDDKIIATTILHNGSIELSAEIDFNDDYISISLAARNTGNKNIHIISLYPLITAPSKAGLRLSGVSDEWHLFQMSWNMTTPTASVKLNSAESDLYFRLFSANLLPRSVKAMIFNEGSRISRIPGVFTSEWFTMLSTPSGTGSALIGFTQFEKHFSQIKIGLPSHEIAARAQGDGCLLEPTETFKTAPLVLSVEEQPFENLKKYARLAAKNHPPRTRDISLWCSWYSGFYDRITEESLLDNLEKLKTYSPMIEYFQIDDGYEASFGRWTETHPKKFKSTLPEIAKKITDAGFKPGIWTAPFAISMNSPVYSEHPDWLVKGPKGKPQVTGFIMGKFGPRPYYSLDTSNPDALDWVKALFRQLADFGFELFKIDFLTASAIPGIRYNNKLTRSECYRQGIKAIREALPDKVLLAAISPVLSNSGLVDVQRVSNDTSFGKYKWQSRFQKIFNDMITPSLKSNIRNSITRSFTHNILFTNDCDAIINQRITMDERRSLYTINLLLGGVTAVGNDFRFHEFDFLPIQELSRYTKKDIRVLDISIREMPEEILLDAELEGEEYFLYALFNWSDKTATKQVRITDFIPQYHYLANQEVFDYWGRRMVRFNQKELLPLPPHGCKMLIIKKKRD